MVSGFFSDGSSFDFAHLLEQGSLTIVPQGRVGNSYHDITSFGGIIGAHDF